MRKLLLVALVFPFLLISCAKHHLPTKNVATNATSTNPYKISQREALNELQQFLQSSCTKSSELLSHKKIGTIQPVRISSKTKTTLTKSIVRTKSGGIDDICVPDTLLYIVNFDDDGFAILSADTRISSTILAVVESGTISPLHFDVIQYLNEQFSNDTLLYTYYQFDEDDDEEEFDEDIDFNELFDDLDDEDEQDYNDDQNGKYILDAPEEIVGSMVYDYAIDEIINNPNPNPLLGSSSDTNVQVGGDTSSVSGWSAPNYQYWLTTQEVPTLLTTLWYQSDTLEVINKYTPIKQNGKHAPLGCGAVAVSQILAYNEHPKHFTLNGIYFDWEKLKSVENISSHLDGSIKATAEYQENIDLLAKFMYLIGRLCKTHYRQDDSWTLAKNYRNAFYATVYRNVHRLVGYHGNTIINMLNNSAPVLISANSKWSLNKPFDISGHTWVIDGYKIQKKLDINSNNYVGERILLHCNWGWGEGYCNGYYESKIFKLKNGAIEWEWYEQQSNINTSFSWAYRIYSYNKPNN